VNFTGSTAGNNALICCRINGDTGNNYTFNARTNAGVINQTAATSTIRVINGNTDKNKANLFQLLIPSTRQQGKVCVGVPALSAENDAAGGQYLTSAFYTAAADVTSIKIYDYDGSNITGVVELYGIT